MQLLISWRIRLGAYVVCVIEKRILTVNQK